MIKINHRGRLGNILLQDIGASVLSKKFDLVVTNYLKNYEHIQVDLHQGKKIILNDPLQVSDDNIDEILKKESLDCALELTTYFQTKFFVTQFKNEIKNHVSKNVVTKKNGVFIHVRLDDATCRNPGFNYYDECLKQLSFTEGFISSDTPNHKIVNDLVNKYNLQLYQNSASNTILFAKDFDNLVLSGGTFSWWIGFLSQASNILYPKNHLDWHGDIFVYNNWNGISC